MEHHLLKKLGTNLRQIRQKRGLTQEKLAEKAQMHPVYISYIEKGSRNASISKILNIAMALETTAEDIFKGIF